MARLRDRIDLCTPYDQGAPLAGRLAIVRCVSCVYSSHVSQSHDSVELSPPQEPSMISRCAPSRRSRIGSSTRARAQRAGISSSTCAASFAAVPLRELRLPLTNLVRPRRATSDSPLALACLPDRPMLHAHGSTVEEGIECMSMSRVMALYAARPLLMNAQTGHRNVRQHMVRNARGWPNRGKPAHICYITIRPRSGRNR